MKVICIDDRPPLDSYAKIHSVFLNGHLVKGEEYTVIGRYEATHPKAGPCFIIEEKPILFEGRSVGWGAFRFTTPEYYRAEFELSEPKFAEISGFLRERISAGV